MEKNGIVSCPKCKNCDFDLIPVKREVKRTKEEDEFSGLKEELTEKITWECPECHRQFGNWKD